MEQQDVSSRGVIYLSKLPPYYDPRSLRHAFEEYGITRMHCARVETKARAFSKGDYKEAWIEFSDKEVAKRVVLSYNNQPVGGPKKYKFKTTLWVMKYLSGFDWSQLQESQAHDKELRKQQLNTNLLHSRKRNSSYLKAVDQATQKKQKGDDSEETRDFTQKKVKGGTKTRKTTQLNIFQKKPQKEQKEEGPDTFFIK